MKFSNFELTQKGSCCVTGEKPYKAMVDVETGFLWWKRKKRREITRSYMGSWYFSDTGKFVHSHIEMAELERAWFAQHG
jgi:hypothetical protein